MEFAIESADLASVVGLVRSIVPSKTTIPVLCNVKIATTQDGIAVTGTRLDAEATATARCEVISPGEVTVPAHVLFSLAKALPKKKIATLKADGGRVLLSCGASNYNLRSLPTDEFPVMADMPDDAATFVMPASELKSALDATKATILPPTAERPYLQGVFVWVADGQLVFVSTDGHRLAETVKDRPEGLSAMPPAIIPADAVREIIGILDAADGADAIIEISERRIGISLPGIGISLPGILFQSKLIEGKYPAYRKLIPAENSGGVRVKASALGEAVARLAVVYAGSDTKAPIARCQSNGGTLDLTAGKAGGDAGAESVDVEVLSPISFGVSANYLAEMIGLWPSDAMLHITAGGEPGSPILITSADVPDQKHVLMPMS